MINKEDLLQKAHGFFLDEQYDKALFLYSRVSSLEPSNKEYQIYALFCDLSSDNNEKAQELFEKFLILKEDNINEAIKYVEDEIATFDGDNELLLQMIEDVSIQTVESLDAIDYQDFLRLEKDRGSFKTAYEDIMYSTKVSITKKEDLVDFINKLIEHGFNSTAYTYLDGFNEVFSYDKDLTDLYEKLESKKIENKHK
jgi:tetratricopeptide (TPR) repeat protein